MPPPPDADALIAAIDAHYAEVDHLTARFRLDIHSEAFGKDTLERGTVWLARPGKMRWDFADTDILLGTDDVLISIDRQGQTILQRSGENMYTVATSFLYGLASRFVGTVDDGVLTLQPRTPSPQYRTLQLWVDNDVVVRAVVEDTADNTFSIRLFDPVEGEPKEEPWFEFRREDFADYTMTVHE